MTKTATKDTQSTPFISPDEAAVLAAGARAYIASGRMAPYVVREVAEEIHKWLNASEWK